MWTISRLICRFFQQPGLIFFLLTVCIFSTGNACGQKKVSCNEISEEMGFTVKSVKIAGRWVPKELQLRVEQTIGIDQVYSQKKVMAAQSLIADELELGTETFGLNLKTAVEFTYLTWDACSDSNTSETREVQIIIYPYYFRIDLYNLGNNILPLPRSAKSSFLTKVPKLLLATSPLVTFSNDRTFGPSLMLQTTTDLLHIPGLAKENNGVKNLKLDLGLDARKSLSNNFYDFGGQLGLLKIFTDSTAGWNAGVYYSNRVQPLGSGEYRQEAAQIYAGITGISKPGILIKYAIGGSTSFLQSKYHLLSNEQLQNSENAYEFYALSDGKLAGGFTRLGIWFNAGIPKNNNVLDPYQRLAGRVGYGISLGSGHNNIDIEANVGSGYIWGTPPQYSQFYAGNTAWNFLYEPFASEGNRAFPEGAVVRSLGEKEGGLENTSGAIQGGRSYWNVNMSLSIPISKWARPLIPDTTLQRKLKKLAIQTAKNTINDDLVDNQGLPDDDETTSKAGQIVDKDIAPVITYITDRANIVSVKPLVFFDVARISQHMFAGRTWVATGLGIQLNIVIARFEAGYMHTVFPSSESNKGNFLLRLTFQNFY